MSKRLIVALAALAAGLGAQPPAAVHGRQAGAVAVLAPAGGDLRSWDARVERMIRGNTLQVRLDREDTLLPGRRHTRFRQLSNDVPVYGGEIARQTDPRGVTISILGTLYDGIDIPTEPALTADDIRERLTRTTGIEVGPDHAPQLVILPRGGATYTLAYLARVATPGDITLYFIDANTGAVLEHRSDAHTQAAVGIGTGVLGGRRKVSASAQAGVFVGSDRLRPPVIETYDMRGNLNRTVGFLNGMVSLGPSDLASDDDNVWTDGANVDAHTFTGLTYDYYFKRFGRRGLDNANIRIRTLTHPVNRSDFFSYSASVRDLYFTNAFYAGDGIMVYGEGLPTNVTAGGQRWNFLAGSFDVVAHELSHGVIDFTSDLIYRNESGALNEAFCDIMAASAAFFYQPQRGAGIGPADYVVGNDVITPGGIRSMEDPGIFGDPDHYSRRFTGRADNGGVHINSTIAGHAFYLAVEGGTNRTSRIAVAGVGAGNRDQMEKVFYRAFTQLMPPNSTFSTARAATIQAAQDLFGSNSPAERAVAQAWTAVGVD